MPGTPVRHTRAQRVLMTTDVNCRVSAYFQPEGDSLTQKYPVTPTIVWPREWGASSTGARMAKSVNAPFDCAIPQGCL